MQITKAMENSYSMLLVVPAKLRRELGWIRGDTLQVYMKAGILMYQKVRVTNVKYRRTESARGPADHIDIKGKPSIR